MHDGAGTAGLPNRNLAALALIFGMHILAMLAWMHQRPARLPDAPHAVAILLRTAPPSPPSPQRKPEPAEPPPPAIPIPRPRTPRIDGVLGGAAPAPVAAPAKPAAETPIEAAAVPSAPATSPSLDDARAPITVQDAIREQQQAGGGIGLNLSKRQAGRIDRELRGGKSGVPDEPDTPMGRFRRALERAHIDRSRTVIEDSYTSPDGVVIYRRRIGNKSICYRSGSVSPLGMSGMLMPNEAGNVTCPSGVQWKKED